MDRNCVCRENSSSQTKNGHFIGVGQVGVGNQCAVKFIVSPLSGQLLQFEL